jgi:hypothetical protein
MDFLARHRKHRIILVATVALIAILANLPKSISTALHLEPEYLMAVLGILLLLGLFLWEKVSLLLLTVLLVVGANLPERWALGLNFDKLPLYAALGFMVLGSLFNRWANLLPTGTEPPTRRINPEGFRALMTAIVRRQSRSVDVILKMNVAVDFIDENGLSPLMLAAATGQADIVEKLLAAGARPDLPDAEGRCARDHALKSGYDALAHRLSPADTPPRVAEVTIGVMGTAPVPASGR